MAKKYPLSDLLKNSFYHRSRPSEDLYERVDSDFRVIEGKVMKSNRKTMITILLIVVFVSLVGRIIYSFSNGNIFSGSSYNFQDLPGYEGRSKYINKDQNYSLHYPPEFLLVDDSDPIKVSIGDGIVPKITISSYFVDYNGDLKDWAEGNLEKLYGNIWDLETVKWNETTLGGIDLVQASYGEIKNGYDGRRTISYIRNGDQIILLQTMTSYKDLTQTEFQEKVLRSLQLLVGGDAKYRGVDDEKLLEMYFEALKNFDYQTQYDLQSTDRNEDEYLEIAKEWYEGTNEFSFSKPQSLGNDEYEYFAILFNKDSNENLWVKKSVKDGKITHIENKYFTTEEFLEILKNDEFLRNPENWDGSYPTKTYEKSEEFGVTENFDGKIIEIKDDESYSYGIELKTAIVNGQQNYTMEIPVSFEDEELLKELANTEEIITIQGKLIGGYTESTVLEIEEILGKTDLSWDLEITNLSVNSVKAVSNGFQIAINAEVKNNGPEEYLPDDEAQEFFAVCYLGSRLDYKKNETTDCRNWFDHGMNDITNQICYRGGNHYNISRIRVDQSMPITIYITSQNLDNVMRVGCSLNYDKNADMENSYRNNYFEKDVSLSSWVNVWGYGYSQ